MTWSNLLKGTRMFRGMTDEQRSKIDRSLEHHKALDVTPFTDSKGNNWVIYVDFIDEDEDTCKKSFALLDSEGIPVTPPFCPSPYSGTQELKNWIEEGRPNDSKFQSNNLERRLKLMHERMDEEFGSSRNQS